MKVPVLVPKIFNFPFTYDSGHLDNLNPGDIVIVPFGKSKEVAEAIAKGGQSLEKKFITVAGGNVKRAGKYTAKVRLHRSVVIDLPFEVVGE